MEPLCLFEYGLGVSVCKGILIMQTVMCVCLFSKGRVRGNGG